MSRTSDGSRISVQRMRGCLIDFHKSAYPFQHDLCRWRNDGFVYTSVDLQWVVGMRPECVLGVCFGEGDPMHYSLGTSDTPRPPKQMLLLLSREMRSYRHYDHNHCTLTYYKLMLITIWWDSRFFWSLLESSTVSARAPEMRHTDSERVSGNEKRLECCA